MINTHSHGGHTGGNTEFGDAKEIVAHTNALVQMRTQKEFSDGRGLPNRTFTNRLTLGEGDDRIELFYFGRGHTNGDAWVLFPAARVLYTDVFIGKEMPIIDGGNGGSGLEYVETLTKAVTAFDGRVDRIVTGHGGMATIGDLREYADFCRDLIASIQAGKTAGRSAEEIANGAGGCRRSTSVMRSRRLISFSSTCRSFSTRSGKATARISAQQAAAPVGGPAHASRLGVPRTGRRG